MSVHVSLVFFLKHAVQSACVIEKVVLYHRVVNVFDNIRGVFDSDYFEMIENIEIPIERKCL